MPDIDANDPDGGFDASDASIVLKAGAVLKEGERRTVTVLFADMKGFTSLSERSDPEEMDILMGRVFSRFDSIICKHGGYVEKYIGDALVAVFGVPELHEDDAARAIDSALEFISSIRRPGSGLPDGLAFRTGVHTGLVTTGRRGDHEVVTGHTLAVASRLQSAAPANGILVSAVTREACEKQFVFADPQELVLKGKDERVLAYQALARRKAIFDYRTPFVDRKQALETLTGEYVRHMRGSIGGVYVLGDGGIGKTRLVAEFWARLKGFPGFQATFLSINPSLFGAFEYAAALNAVADFLDLRPDATFEEFCAAVKDRTDLEEKWLKHAYGLFNPMERPAGESSFATALAALFDAILASDGDAYPDVIFVDNARLMDESSLEFFRSYRNAAKSRPFVVLCDRTRSDPAAGVFGVETELRLEPLSKEDSSVLARLLYTDGLDDEAVAMIVERSQGYPLFIEEYVKLARQNSDLHHLPESIQTTILAALERLDPEARNLARRLSVLRYPFAIDFATTMQGARSDAGCTDLQGCLDRLGEERILNRAGEGLWSFKHSIVREAIYSSLLLHNRKLLHALAAEYLRSAGQGRPVDIFYHLAEAESWQAARAYLVQERPQLPLESLPLLQKLIDNCPETALGELIELHFIKYATNYNNKAYKGLRPIVHEMYRLALRSRKRFYLARCYHLLMTTYYMDMDYRSATLYGSKALEAYEGGGNEKGACNARTFLALCFAGMDRFDRALAVLNEIPRTDPYTAGLYDAGMAAYHRMRGEYEASARFARKIIADAEARGDVDEICQRKAMMLAESLQNFRFDDAWMTDRPERLYCGLDGETSVPFHAALALSYRFAGDVEASTKAFASADYHLAQLHSDEERAAAGAALSWARLLAGDRKEAREKALAGLEASVRSRHYTAMFECQTNLSELAYLEGNAEEFAFFVTDACILAGAPIYRERKSLARYFYFAWVLMDSSPAGFTHGETLRRDERDEYLAEAKRLLEEELAALGDDEVRERALALSIFDRIAKA
jgi:class 3 adenylate cyclase